MSEIWLDLKNQGLKIDGVGIFMLSQFLGKPQPSNIPLSFLYISFLPISYFFYLKANAEYHVDCVWKREGRERKW